MTRESPFSKSRLRLPIKTQNSSVASFAKRKVSFDINEEIDITSRFLTSPHANCINSKLFSKHIIRSSSSTAQPASTKRSSGVSSKCSLSRLSRSGCLRLLDEVSSSSTEPCRNQTKSLGCTAVSEDDMYCESQADICADEESSPPLVSRDNTHDYFSSCWGHFVEINGSDQESQQIRNRHNQHSIASSSFRKRSSRISKFTPYSKDKQSYSRRPRTLRSTSTDDISTAMNNISLHRLL